MRRPRPVDPGHDPHQHAGARGGAAPGKRARTDRLPPTPGLAAPAPGGHAFYPMPGEGSVGADRPPPSYLDSILGDGPGASAAPVVQRKAEPDSSFPDGAGGDPARRASSLPDVEVHPARLVVAPTVIGARGVLIGTLVNRDGDDLALDALEVDHRAFEVEWQGGNVLRPGASATFVLGFRPTPPMIGSQRARLRVSLQDGRELAVLVEATALSPGGPEPEWHLAPPVAETRRPPAGGPTPSPSRLGPGFDPRDHQGPQPDQCRPGATTERCEPDRPSAWMVAGVRATRVHNPGQAGEFRDPVATTLYPQDVLEVAVELGGAQGGNVTGRILDTAGLLLSTGSSYAHPTVQVTAEALRAGSTNPSVELSIDGAATARVPLAPLRVVAERAKEEGEGESRRVNTRDINDAVRLLIVAAKSVLLSQKQGVLDAQRTLLERPAARPMHWAVALVAAGAEAALSFVTAGIGNRLGRALASWSAGARDLAVGGIPVFDLESAFGTGLKDGLKALARTHIEDRNTRADGMSVEESWAIALLCSAQALALEKKALDLEARLLNGAVAYKDLEAKQPGLGLAAVEAHRHALESTHAAATSDAAHATVREWLKILSRSTHGAHAVLDGTGKPARDPDGGVLEGTHLGRPGRGHLEIHGKIVDANGPLAIESMSIAGVEGRAGSALRGSVGALGLPYVVTLGSTRLGRNEVGQVWATFNRYTGFRVKEYLHARGTGRLTWLDEADRQRGIDAGIGVVLDELAEAEVKVP